MANAGEGSQGSGNTADPLYDWIDECMVPELGSLTQEELSTWPNDLHGSWERQSVPPNVYLPAMPEQPYHPYREGMHAIASFDWEQHTTGVATGNRNELGFDELVEANMQEMMTSPSGSESGLPEKRVRFGYSYEDELLKNRRVPSPVMTDNSPTQVNGIQNNNRPVAPKTTPQTQQTDASRKGNPAGRSVSSTVSQDVVMSNAPKNQNTLPRVIDMALGHSTQTNKAREDTDQILKQHIRTMVHRPPTVSMVAGPAKQDPRVKDRYQEATERYVRAKSARKDGASAAGQGTGAMASAQYKAPKQPIVVEKISSLPSAPINKASGSGSKGEEESRVTLELAPSGSQPDAGPSATINLNEASSEVNPKHTISDIVPESVVKEAEGKEDEVTEVDGDDDVVMGEADAINGETTEHDGKPHYINILSDDTSSSFSDTDEEVLPEGSELETTALKKDGEEKSHVNGSEMGVTASEDDAERDDGTSQEQASSEDDMDEHGGRSDVATNGSQPRTVNKSKSTVNNKSNPTSTEESTTTPYSTSPRPRDLSTAPSRTSITTASSQTTSSTTSSNPAPPSTRATRSKKPPIIPGLGDAEAIAAHEAWIAETAAKKEAKRLKRESRVRRSGVGKDGEKEAEEGEQKKEDDGEETAGDNANDHSTKRLKRSKSGRYDEKGESQIAEPTRTTRTRTTRTLTREAEKAEVEKRTITTRAKEQAAAEQAKKEAEQAEALAKKETEAKMKERRARRESMQREKEIRLKLEERRERRGRAGPGVE